MAATGRPHRDAQVAVDHTIRASWIGAAVAGPAYTVRGSGGDNLALHRAVVAAPPSHVVVADVEGAAHGHWGEILAVAAQQRGILGLVIDGGVRDRDRLRALDFPVFSRHDSIRGTRKDVAGGLGVPIRLGGVPVRTGDLVVGDTDGVVVVPSERVPAVLEEADRRVAREHDILAALRDGRTTLDLYGLG
jgi:4-hydroxy-4-methyl-2-oxoglutarate aldolase